MEKKYKSVEGFSVKTLEIAGFKSAFSALRLPFKREERSDVIWSGDSVSGVDARDVDLLQKLVLAGDEHAKVLRGVLAWARITAPRLFWQEFDTYRVGCEKLSSESSMHTIASRDLTVSDFEVSDEIKGCLAPKKDPDAWHTVLHFDKPEKLECKIYESNGRKYEIWNNGEFYSLEYTTEDKMPNGSIRRRSFPKTRLNIGQVSTRQGYFEVRIGGRGGGREFVHVIMAKTFVPNPENKPFVNHKDGDKGNCSPSNLEWVTSAENNDHARRSGLIGPTWRSRYLAYKAGLKYSDDEIQSWRVMKAGGMTYAEIAKKTGASKSIIEDYVLYDGLYSSSTSKNTRLFREAYSLEKTIETINELSKVYREGDDKSILLDIKALLPESYIQSRVVCLSYQTLRRIYFQRRNHRLPQWRMFCDWIKTLPFANEFITIEK